MQQQAILVAEPSDAKGLVLGQAPIPSAGPGQVQVKVAAAGVNFIETYQRSGVYKVDYPFTPGSEFSGVVTEVGQGVQNFAVGDRVATASGTAGYAQYAVVDAARAGHVPAGVDLQVAAALPLQGMTAHYLVSSTFPLEPGRTALVYAAAGGVGRLLVQLAVRRGARVLACTSTPAKADAVRALGADAVLLKPVSMSTLFDTIGQILARRSGGDILVA